MKNIDIHSHILPGVDDGAEDMDVAVDMARQYVEAGFDRVIATPHYVREGDMDRSVAYNKKVLEDFRQKLEKKDIDLDIYLGSQIYLDKNIIAMLEEGQVSSLNGTSYLLIELPSYSLSDSSRLALEKVLARGYVPVLTHVERNLAFMENPNKILDLIDLGCLIQLDLPSLQGKLGREVGQLAQIMIDCQMVHFLASNSHSNISRSPSISTNRDDLVRDIGFKNVDRLLRINPEKLLKDEIINVKNPKKYNKKISFRDIWKNL